METFLRLMAEIKENRKDLFYKNFKDKAYRRKIYKQVLALDAQLQIAIAHNISKILIHG